MKFLALFLVAMPAVAAEPPFYRELVIYHAPVILQETGGTPRADALTRFDFDGDLDGSNNWENALAFPVPGYVYYSVIESKTHYFLTYGFYHSRDYSRVCLPILCHENDFEGAILTLRKSLKFPFGEVILVETIAHFGNPSTFHPMTLPDPVSGEPRIAIYIERMGHGAFPMTADRKLDPDHVLTYSYGGTAEDPAGAASGTFKYDLLPIKEELWDRSALVGPHSVWSSARPYKGKRFSWPALPFEFNGNGFHGVSRPQPPWSWGSPIGFSIGEWFLDPALVVARHKEIDPGEFSLEYLYHPFMP